MSQLYSILNELANIYFYPKQSFLQFYLAKYFVLACLLPKKFKNKRGKAIPVQV
jgi:hypothetical protein